MVRRYRLEISADLAGRRLDEAVREWIAGELGRPLSKGAVRTLVMAGAIRVDGRPQRRAGLVLQNGSTLDASIDLARLGPSRGHTDAKRGPTLTVLYEDDDLIAVAKPAGLLAHASADPARDDLFTATRRLLAERRHGTTAPDAALPYLGLHHRLDVGTSGVVLFTRQPRANAPLAAQFEAHSVEKVYHALVWLDPQNTPRTVRRSAEPAEDGRRSSAEDAEDGNRLSAEPAEDGRRSSAEDAEDGKRLSAEPAEDGRRSSAEDAEDGKRQRAEDVNSGVRPRQAPKPKAQSPKPEHPSAEWRVSDRLAMSGSGRTARMRAVSGGGAAAVTVFRVLSRLGNVLLLEARPQTGRKHQVRAHLAGSHLPILGDTRYGGPGRVAGTTVPRVMLHAARLAFMHPITQRPMAIECPYPRDFRELLERLEGLRRV